MGPNLHYKQLFRTEGGGLISRMVFNLSFLISELCCSFKMLVYFNDIFALSFSLLHITFVSDR